MGYMCRHILTGRYLGYIEPSLYAIRKTLIHKFTWEDPRKLKRILKNFLQGNGFAERYYLVEYNPRTNEFNNRNKERILPVVDTRPRFYEHEFEFISSSRKHLLNMEIL